MTAAGTVGEACRLVVVGPERQVEVAVPSHVAIADLLPTLLNHLGAALADEGLTHGGWVLQRLGESPLDEDGSAASLGLRDGETVHLRPRSEQLPAVDFDDLIDGVGTGVSERASRWRPEMTRWALLISAAVVLALGLVVVALPGPQLGRALAGGAMAIAGLLGGFAVAYATSERVLSALLAAAGMLYGACAAAVVAGGEECPRSPARRCSPVLPPSPRSPPWRATCSARRDCCSRRWRSPASSRCWAAR
ncbi:type VII secretion integral membrane protein EccD [Phytohabitans flavus]|uniref:type VII secretion integral membrane protein EccD n=1 Tax=Phytohabitans flavus TaxID=1076124 RepID=UPI003640B041